jgi:hypothetical protein
MCYIILGIGGFGSKFALINCKNSLLTTTLRKHIFNDLRPYVCTVITPRDDTCLLPLSSRTAWIKHEMIHLESAFQKIKCPFCPSTKEARPASTYLKHISRHLREVALAVLPQSHDSDSESDVASTSSKQTLSDISSLHGSEMELSPTSPTVPILSIPSKITNTVSETADGLTGNNLPIPRKELELPSAPTSAIANASGKIKPVEDTEILKHEPMSEPTVPGDDKTTLQELDSGSSSTQDPIYINPFGFKHNIPDSKVEETKSDELKPATSENDESKPKIQPCRYKTGKTLGAGSFSVVKECVHIDTGRYYAAKVINKRLMAGREHVVSIDIINR